MAGLLLDERHDLGRLVADHGEQRAEVGTGDAVEPVHGVDGERLADAALERGGAEPLEPVGGGGVELERHAQRRREGGEVAPGLPDGGGGVADASQAQRRRTTGAGGERLEEGRPLVALEDVEVDDVDAVLAGEGLEDGLVGGEVRELDVGAGLVQDLVYLERVRREGERVGCDAGACAAARRGGAGGRERRGGVGGEGEAGGEGVGEVGGHALHGVTERGGDAAEEVEVA